MKKRLQNSRFLYHSEGEKKNPKLLESRDLNIGIVHTNTLFVPRWICLDAVAKSWNSEKLMHFFAHFKRLTFYQNRWSNDVRRLKRLLNSQLQGQLEDS